MSSFLEQRDVMELMRITSTIYRENKGNTVGKSAKTLHYYARELLENWGARAMGPTAEGTEERPVQEVRPPINIADYMPGYKGKTDT